MLFGEFDLAKFSLSEQCNFPCLTLVAEDDNFFAGHRNVGQSLHFYRNGWPACLNRMTSLVQHCANAAKNCAGQNDITTFERSRLHQNGRYGSAPLVHPGFNHYAASGSIFRRL